MNSSARILIPVGLFVAFAFAHLMASRNELVRVELVVAKERLRNGRRAESGQLGFVVVYANLESATSLRKSFAEHGERGTDVILQTLNRDIQPGELVSLADLMSATGHAPVLEPGEVGIQIPLKELEFSASQLKVGSNVGFVLEDQVADGNVAEPTLLQPFRLIGIGDEVTVVRDAGSTEDPPNARILTIAAKTKEGAPNTFEDPQITLLLRATSGNESKRITNVVVMPEVAVKKGN